MDGPSGEIETPKLSYREQQEREVRKTDREWEGDLRKIYPGFDRAFKLIHDRYGNEEDKRGSATRSDLRGLFREATADWVSYKPENLGENCEILINNLIERYKREDEKQVAFEAEMDESQPGLHTVSGIREAIDKLPNNATVRDFMTTVKKVK